MTALLYSAAALLIVPPAVILLHAIFWRPLRLRAFYTAQGVTGTPFRPLVGDLLALAKARASLPFFEWFSPFDAAYGRLHYMFFGVDLRLRILSPGLANEVLVTHARSFHKTELMRATLGRVMSAGLLLSEGEAHRRHRSMISPAFTCARLQGMAPLIARAAARAVRGLTTRPRDAVVDAHEEMSNLTLYIIGRAAFGADFEGLLPPALAHGEEAAPPPRVAASAADAAGVHGKLAWLLDYMIKMVSSPLLLLPGGSLLPVARTATALIGDLRALARGIIAARRAARASEGASAPPATTAAADAAASAAAAAAADSDAANPVAPEEADNLLDHLLDAEDGGRGFTTEEVLDESLTFVLAGHETTAKALSWALLLLAQHPVELAALRGEAAAVLGGAGAAGSPPPRLPTRDDVASLPLLCAVLQEALRLYPPAPLVARECVAGCTLRAAGEGPRGGDALRVAKGTTVVIPVATLQRDPALWEEPEAFRPRRWLVAGGRFSATACLKHPLAFCAFSQGPRNCIGAGFALLEARLILAVLVSRVGWELDASYRHLPGMAITLRPTYGLPMRFWALHGAAAEEAAL